MTLSERIRTIVFAFDSRDSRRDDIRKIAAEVEALENELEHAKIQIENLQEDLDEMKRGPT